MASPVTDPELLAALNGPEPKGKVTDPALLAALEGDAHPASAGQSEGAGARALGLAKAAGVGIGKGVIGLAGTIPAISEIAHSAANKYLFDPVFNAISGPPAKSADGSEPVDISALASPGSIQKGVETITGPFYKPQNRAEKYAQTIGEFIPAAAGGAGSLVPRLVTQAVIPAVASEAAGQATEGTAFETPARIGAALVSPFAMSGAGRVIDAARAPAAGMSRNASGHLVKAMEADTPAAVQSEMQRLGPDAMLADAGPAFLGKAQGASLNSDEGRSILFGSLKNRDTGTNSRIQSDVNRALGPAEDPQTVTNAIRAHRTAVDDVAYPAALNNAPDVQTSHILHNIDGMIDGSPVGGLERKALTNLKEMMMKTERQPLLDSGGYPVYDKLGNQRFHDVKTSQNDAGILHKVKGELDNVIEYDAAGLGVPAAALTRQQGALKHLRGELNNALETQVPGYMEANRQSAALARRGEAVELGTKYLGSGKTTASPERFAAAFDPLAQGEKIAFAKGSRGEIDRVLGTKANDLQALRGELQGEGGWNTAKIATVHGQPAADELMATVERNLKFRDTHGKISEGAQTEIRRAAREQMKPSGFSENDIVTPHSNTVGMALTALKRGGVKVVNALTEASRARGREEIARVLTAQGAARDQHVQAIVDALSRRQSSVARNSMGTAAQRAVVAALMAANGRLTSQNGP